MRRLPFFFLCVLLPLLATAGSAAAADTLTVETDYRLRGNSYSGIDFSATPTRAAAGYYSQRLALTIGGSFAPGIEITTRLTALGVAGSTAPFMTAPFPNTNMMPFVERAAVRMTNLFDAPVEMTVGKQSFACGDGLIVADNGIGYTGFKIAGNLQRPLALQAELFTAKIAEQFNEESDYDLYGARASTEWKKNLLELGYFETRDFSGTTYTRGVDYRTAAIVKQFIDIRLGRDQSISAYQIEIAKQGGYVNTVSSGNVSFDALGFVISGELRAKKTKLGAVTAKALLASFSGSVDPLALKTDQTFSPDLTKRYDGLEPAGYGELFAATPLGGFDGFIPSQEFTGINTLSLGADFSPLYAWNFGVTYYLFSAMHGPNGAPAASGFERLYGAEFSLGIELDLSVTYAYSKYLSTRLAFSRYTPPKFDQLWPNAAPATKYTLDVAARF